VSCESCHGPCQAHVDNYDIKTARIVCVRCHAVDPARSTWIRQIEPKKHYAGQRCVECHVPHQPNEVPP
jgi:predicted CXXCH cytochrome family protein